MTMKYCTIGGSTASNSKSSFSPLIATTTSGLVGDNNSNKQKQQQRFIIIPNNANYDKSVTILAYNTGKRITDINIDDNNNNNNNNNDKTNNIKCADVYNNYLFLGCSNGIIYQYDLTKLSSPSLSDDDYQQPINTYNLEYCDDDDDDENENDENENKNDDDDDDDDKNENKDDNDGDNDNMNNDDEKEKKKSTSILRLKIDTCINNEIILYAFLKNNNSKKSSSKAVVSFVKVTINNSNNSISQSKDDDDNSKYQEKQESKRIVIIINKINSFNETKVPFGMKIHHTLNNTTTFCILASQKKLTVYNTSDNSSNNNNNNNKFDKIDLYDILPKGYHLSSIEVCTDDNSIACGFSNGTIYILDNILNQCIEFFKLSHNKKDKKKLYKSIVNSAVIRKLHWHKHSVKTLKYDNNMLYSGGEECVLITWQLQRGVDKATHVLPRIALGSITSITIVNDAINNNNFGNTILITCSDQSYHLYQIHSKQLLWKIQGLATTSTTNTQSLIPNHKPTIMMNDNSNKNNDLILVSGLSGAPGLIQWYDVKQRVVVKELEVAPYNRISKTERNEKSWPTPLITHCCISASTMVTVDIIPTENISIGKIYNNNTYGSVSTIRFWKYNIADNKYESIADMSYPHGINNTIATMSLSNDGIYLVTIGTDKTIRLWNNNINNQEWNCYVKITIPSGFTNFRISNTNTIASFSSDNTVLAIAFGPYITLWNIINNVSLITTLQHYENIETLQFLNSNTMIDQLLVQSKNCIKIQSPYGSGSSGLWERIIPKNENTLSRLSCIQFIPSNIVDLIFFAQYYINHDESRIIILNVQTGNKIENFKINNNEKEKIIRGEIISITGITTTTTTTTTNAVKKGSLNKNDLIINLYMLTSKGILISVSNDEMDDKTKFVKKVTSDEEEEEEDKVLPDDLIAPTIPLLAIEGVLEPNKKKRRKLMTLFDIVSNNNNNISNIIEEIPTLQLPYVQRGNISRTLYIGQHLQKGN